MSNKKLNVAVIFGGVSSEYKISCLSAANVLEILDTDKYNVFVLGVTNAGKWYLTSASPSQIREGKWLDADNRSAFISPDRAVHGIYVCGAKNVRIDVAFPVMHGKNGEDGTVAALLQLAGIPQVTTTMTSAANSMDKVITKILCEKSGIRQADYEFFYKNRISDSLSEAVKKIEDRFDYPVFVKPSSAGSSVGVSKCRNAKELESGLKLAAEHDFKILVEECIVGTEVEAAVIGNFSPRCPVCGQISQSQDFYSFDSKYNDDTSETLIPARFDESIRKRVCDEAIKVYRTMECQGFARVDFFVTDKGDIIFNELNTIPGFTDISMYPKMMAYSGLEGSALADELISLALAEDRI